MPIVSCLVLLSREPRIYERHHALACFSSFRLGEQPTLHRADLLADIDGGVQILEFDDVSIENRDFFTGCFETIGWEADEFTATGASGRASGAQRKTERSEV